jgi:O-antigen ligase
LKWVVLISLLAAIFPMSNWLRRNPHQAPTVWIVMGALPFALFPLHLYMAMISWDQWPGHTKGIEFSALDALAIAVYLTLPPPARPLPFRVSMGLYFGACLLSAAMARVPEAALFYCWQLARMFLVYGVVARGLADPRVAPSLLKGLAVGLFIEAGATVWQRFVLGILEAGGTLGHHNLLGMISHFIIFPFFALMLVGQRSWLPTAVTLAGVVIQVLTTSRATIGLGAVAYSSVFLLSSLRKWTPRKAMVLGIAIATAAVLVPLSLFAIAARGDAALGSSDEERVVLETAASMIVSDHPWGVGANHYVLVAMLDGYNQRAKVNWTSMSATVHNVYWLVLAETGYLGLWAFVILLLHPLIVAFRCGWSHRGDPRGDLLLGLGMALGAVYVHSALEWIFITFQVQYIFAMALGLVAGLAQQLGYWGRPAARRAPVTLASGGLTGIRPSPGVEASGRIGSRRGGQATASADGRSH